MHLHPRLLISIIFCACLFTACDNNEPSSEKSSNDHNHSYAELGTDHKLGKLQIGNVGFIVHQFGEVVGQQKGVFTLKLDNGSISEVRIWVGQADEQNPIKQLLIFNEEKNEYHGHAELPGTINDKTALWVELTNKNKRVTKGQIPLKL